MKKAIMLLAFLFSASMLSGVERSISNPSTSFGSVLWTSFNSTFVSGYISVNTTWTLSDSPYIVVGDVIVERDVMLTIEPGVTVKFTPGTKIIVDGIFVSQGNATHKILFTSNSTSPSPGDWGSIILREPKFEWIGQGIRSRIEWSIIEYADIGITVADRSILHLENSLILNNNVGVSMTRTHNVWIKNSSITNNKFQGLYGEIASAPLDEVTISHNGGDGVWIGYNSGASMRIRKSSIINNGGNGLTITAGSVEYSIRDSTISNNSQNGINIEAGEWLTLYIARVNITNNGGAGIYRRSGRAEYPADRILLNRIRGNKQSGIHYFAKPTHIHYNVFEDNTPYDIRNGGQEDINATNNWWGTTNTTLINQRIYDYYDDYNVGKVYFIPTLTTATMPSLVYFTHSPTVPFVGEVVTFEAVPTSRDITGGIMMTQWDFGDGYITRMDFHTVVEHVYDKEGMYNVTLTATYQGWLTDTISKTVKVVKAPVALFTFSPESPLVGEIVTFNAFSSTPDGGTLVSYAWDFGDEHAGNGMIATHVYASQGTYTVTLNITDSEGVWDTELKLIVVRKTPIASFTFRPASPLAGETVIFNASSSTPEGGTISSYTWDFDDGSVITVSVPIITHVYLSTGVFEVTLTVTDTEELTNAVSTIVQVLNDTIPPVANAGQNRTVNLGTTVTFDGGNSSDNVDIVSYEWDFGDGTTGTGKRTTHTYANPGSYTVTLTVRDSAGNADAHSISVTVLGASAPFLPTEAFPLWIAGVATGVIGIAVAAIILWRRRK